MGFIHILFITFMVASLSKHQSFCLDPLTKDPNHNHCTSDFNCSANAYCHQSKTCLCKDHYVPDREPIIPGKKAFRTVCLKEASFIGDYCKKDIQCKSVFGLHSECIFREPNSQIGSCQCSEGSHFKFGDCYKTSLIGERCDVNDNCFTKSTDIQAYCDSGRCVCPPKYHSTVDASDCQPSSGLDGPCLDNSGCMTLNSECKHGFCRCQQKYIAGDQKQFCLLLAEKLEDPCEMHDQCTVILQNARCDEQRGVCVCENDSHNVDGTCWKTARFLEPCKYNPECLANNGSRHGIICKDGLCQCKDGYVMEEQSYCLKVNSTETNTGLRLSPKILLSGGLLLLIFVKSFQ